MTRLKTPVTKPNATAQRAATSAQITFIPRVMAIYPNNPKGTCKRKTARSQGVQCEVESRRSNPTCPLRYYWLEACTKRHQSAITKFA